MSFPTRLRPSRLQRIVLAIYFLSLAYCFVWVPWSITSSDRYGTDHERLGYGWIWAGPRLQFHSSEKVSLEHPTAVTGTANLKDFVPEQTSKQPANAQEFSDVDAFVAAQTQGYPSEQEQWEARAKYAFPDMTILAFRIIAATTITGAAFLLAGIAKNSAST
jgi:hypothetical protein